MNYHLNPFMNIHYFAHCFILIMLHFIRLYHFSFNSFHQHIRHYLQTLFSKYTHIQLSFLGICRRMKFVPEQFSFRDTFLYNNYMYMALGHVAERLGGDTWENLLASRVLRSIGMMSTKIMKVPDDVYEDGIALPYIYDNSSFQNSTKSLYR